MTARSTTKASMNTTSSTSSATAVDYDYDINEAFQSYDWSELVPAVVVYLMILLLGVGGNSLIICTIARYRRLKTVTNTFLASLASADLLLVLVCIPFNVSRSHFSTFMDYNTQERESTHES